MGTNNIRSHHKDVLNIVSTTTDDDKIIQTHFYAESLVHITFTNRLQLPALLDSGAGVNCIASSTLKQLNPRPVTQMCNKQVANTSGSNMRCTGYFYLSFYIANNQIRDRF